MAGDDFAASFAGPGPSDCHAGIARDFLPKPGVPTWRRWMMQSISLSRVIEGIREHFKRKGFSLGPTNEGCLSASFEKQNRAK